jgi:hypothetical protein
MKEDKIDLILDRVFVVVAVAVSRRLDERGV